MLPPQKPSTGSQIIAYILGLACVVFGLIFIKISISDGTFDMTEIMFLVVSLPIIIIGIGIIWLNTYSSIEIRNEEYQNGQRFPNDPWEWKSEWADGRIKCDSKSVVSINFFIAFFCSGVVIVCAKLAEHEDSVMGMFFTSLIALLAGMYWLKAISSFFNYRYFGPVEFHLEKMPAAIGETFTGVVHGLKSKSRILKIESYLECRQRVPQEDGPPEIKVINKQRKKLRPKREVDDFEFHIPIKFDIPKDLPATNWQNKEKWFEWVLVLLVNDKGREHRVEFILPVF